ncbi:MAG: hypothetical protein ACREJB_05910, partial [Planctomycetaceae bacterium]
GSKSVIGIGIVFTMAGLVFLIAGHTAVGILNVGVGVVFIAVGVAAARKAASPSDSTETQPPAEGGSGRA